MRTRSQARKRRQQQVQQTSVESSNLEKPDNPPIVTMADNRTMTIGSKHPPCRPTAHIRYFIQDHLYNKDSECTKYGGGSVKLMLFPFSLEGAARIWLEKEPPRSIETWDDLVTKFINKFFPPSKTTNLRNEITRFQQKFDETFCEAWDRFNDLLRGCPHHGFSELHQLDTFYNALNSIDQDSLNSAAGGNFLDKMPRECLKIIESKSKVRQSRNKVVVAKMSTSSSTPAISSDVAELKDMVRALILDRKNQTPASAPVKAVEQSCVTCGGGHFYQNCPATNSNIYHDNIQEYVSQAAAANFNQANSGYRPPMVSNQIRPPGFPPIQNPHANSQNNFNRGNNFNQNRENQNLQPASTSSSGILLVHCYQTKGRFKRGLKSKLYLPILNTAFLEMTTSYQHHAKELSLGEKPIDQVLSHKRAIAWKLSDIQGINPEFCTHKILMEEDYKPTVQHQRRVNPKIHDVIKNEVEKLFGRMDRFTQSPIVIGARKDTFTPFMDQMLERLEGNEYILFPWMVSPGISKFPIDLVIMKRPIYLSLREHNGKSLHGRLLGPLGIPLKIAFSSLEKMLQRCEDTNLCLNWEKSHFMVKEGIVLGHKISKNGIEVDKAKIDVIAKLPHPTTVKGYSNLSDVSREMQVIEAVRPAEHCGGQRSDERESRLTEHCGRSVC
ncbi:reverse transcriptase domain-containing protein [Tanacetum coccineum]